MRFIEIFSNLSDYMNSVLCFGVDAADQEVFWLYVSVY